jgi:uncharacterized membrane protein
MSTIERYVVASFDTRARAEAALRRLGLEGIDLRRLALVGKDFRTEQHAVGLVTMRDVVLRQMARAASFGALWGLLFGGGFLVMPALGPLAVKGPLLVWILGALGGALFGAAVGALGGLLQSRGPDADRPVKFAPELQTGTFLVIARGSELFLKQARAILGEWGAARPAEQAPVHAPQPTTATHLERAREAPEAIREP